MKIDRENRENIWGQKILVVGMGRSGIACARELSKLGAQVHVQDARAEEDIDTNLVTFLRGSGIKCYFHSIPQDLGIFDMVVLSPGVDPCLDFVLEAKRLGAEIIGELEIAYRIGKGNYIAITGTNGKTTTTTLVGEIFEKAGRKTSVVGNIGVAVISASAEAKESDWLVTETSSFQLETTKYFKPMVSAILNLTPDHLNRHHTMENYGDAKAKIYQNQREDGYFVYNFDDEDVREIIGRHQPKAKLVPFSIKKELEVGAFVKDEKILIRDFDGKEVVICPTKDIQLIGRHNLENVLAASAISYFAGISPEGIAKGIREFRGVEHRIEYVANVDGVKYYNDSKGTNTDATLTAIRAFDEPITLIAGGDGKGQDFDDFVREAGEKVKNFVILGRDGHLIVEALQRAGYNNYTICQNMDECVKKSAILTEKGGVVLMSPACASWDMYDDYEQRGRHFKSCVDRLLR